MPRVGFDNERFEAAFEVYADDPDAAQAVMTPAFLEHLMEVSETETSDRGTGAIKAGFAGDSFWLALERSAGFIEMPSLSTSVSAIEPRLHAIFTDIEMVERIIDRLHLDDAA